MINIYKPNLHNINSIKNVFDDAINQRRKLINKNIFKQKDLKFDKAEIVYFWPTRYCPVGCKHCWLKSPSPSSMIGKNEIEGTVTDEDINKVINFMKERQTRKFVISGGGEPLFVIGKVKDIVKQAADIPTLEIIEIQTSGYIFVNQVITKRILKEFDNIINHNKKLIIYFRLSLDEGHKEKIPLDRMINVMNASKNFYPKIQVFFSALSNEKVLYELAELSGGIVEQANIEEDPYQVFKILRMSDGRKFYSYWKPLMYTGKAENMDRENEADIIKNYSLMNQKYSVDGKSGRGGVKDFVILHKKLYLDGYNMIIKSRLTVEINFATPPDNRPSLRNSTPSDVFDDLSGDVIVRTLTEEGIPFVESIIEEIEPEYLRSIKLTRANAAFTTLAFQNPAIALYTTLRLLNLFYNMGKLDKKNIPNDIKKFIIYQDKRQLIKLYRKAKNNSIKKSPTISIPHIERGKVVFYSDIKSKGMNRLKGKNNRMDDFGGLFSYVSSSNTFPEVVLIENNLHSIQKLSKDLIKLIRYLEAVDLEIPNVSNFPILAFAGENLFLAQIKNNLNFMIDNSDVNCKEGWKRLINLKMAQLIENGQTYEMDGYMKNECKEIFDRIGIKTLEKMSTSGFDILFESIALCHAVSDEGKYRRCLSFQNILKPCEDGSPFGKEEALQVITKRDLVIDLMEEMLGKHTTTFLSSIKSKKMNITKKYFEILESSYKSFNFSEVITYLDGFKRELKSSKGKKTVQLLIDGIQETYNKIIGNYGISSNLLAFDGKIKINKLQAIFNEAAKKINKKTSVVIWGSLRYMNKESQLAEDIDWVVLGESLLEERKDEWIGKFIKECNKYLNEYSVCLSLSSEDSFEEKSVLGTPFGIFLYLPENSLRKVIPLHKPTFYKSETDFTKVIFCSPVVLWHTIIDKNMPYMMNNRLLELSKVKSIKRFVNLLACFNMKNDEYYEIVSNLSSKDGDYDKIIQYIQNSMSIRKVSEKCMHLESILGIENIFAKDYQNITKAVKEAIKQIDDKTIREVKNEYMEIKLWVDV